MLKELVFGHKAPDTDAIVASIAQAYLQNKLGNDVEAVALGSPNEETKYVLDHFNYKPLRVISEASPEVNKVMLVDHNEPQQSVNDLNKVQVTNVVDHHRIANFNTSAPLNYRAAPLGSTSTILYQMFKENNIDIPSDLAGLLLSAVLSDTLNLKSPTTTDEDKKVVKDLSKIAKIKDYESYGKDMLKAGTDIDNKSDDQILNGDAKTFEMGNNKIRIGQVNVVSFNDIDKRLPNLKRQMQIELKKGNFKLVLLLVTDILNNDSKLIVVGEPKKAIEKAFNKSLNNNDIMDLPNVVSRKKQVVPPLNKSLSEA